VRARAKNSTKPYMSRDVELNNRAWEAFEAQRQYPALATTQAFWNAYTDTPWNDIQLQ
jgi:hypothetical protein